MDGLLCDFFSWLKKVLFLNRGRNKSVPLCSTLESYIRILWSFFSSIGAVFEFMMGGNSNLL